MKISELEECKNLEGTYTIVSAPVVGSNGKVREEARKVPMKLLQNAVDGANAQAAYAKQQGDYAKQVGDTYEGRIGGAEGKITELESKLHLTDIYSVDGYISINGNVYAGEVYKTTGFLPIAKDVKVTNRVSQNYVKVAFYNENEKFISAILSDTPYKSTIKFNEIEIPEGAYYFRVTNNYVNTPEATIEANSLASVSALNKAIKKYINEVAVKEIDSINSKIDSINSKKVIVLSAWTGQSSIINNLPVGSYAFNSYNNTLVQTNSKGSFDTKEMDDNTIYLYGHNQFIWDTNKLFCIEKVLNISSWGIAQGLDIGALMFDEQTNKILMQVDFSSDKVSLNIEDNVILKYDNLLYDYSMGQLPKPIYNELLLNLGITKYGETDGVKQYNQYLYADFKAGDKIIVSIYGTAETKSNACAVRDSAMTNLLVVPNNTESIIELPNDTNYIKLTVNANNVIEVGTINLSVKKGLSVKLKEVEEQKKWIGKKWVCVGDSLTESNKRTLKNYHDYVAEKTGISVVNMGKSGTGYKRTESENTAFYQRVQDIPSDADVITIFGSGNDNPYFASALGTSEDSGTETIGGCINTTIDNILAKLPLAVIGIISPTPWIGYPPSNSSNGMSKYSELLKEICYKRGIPFLDLFHCSGLRPDNATFRELAYSRDEGNGVHPDEKGHALIAPRFEAFLDTMLLH